jgi:DNA ligase-1
MSNYPVQKALHLHEAKKVKKFQFGEYIVLEKLDGWYCYIDCIGGEWNVLRSRVGREIPSLKHLSEAFRNIPVSTYDKNDSVRFVFEVTIPNETFHVANGILNRKTELALEAVLNLHDCIQLEQSKLDYASRYKLCMTYFSSLQHYVGKVELVPYLFWGCDTEEHAMQIFQEVTSRGGEGIILKELNAGYHFGKRNNTLMKIKEEVTKDLLVVGMVEGKGKYLGTLGALQVRTKSGVVMEVSGMSDLERREWWYGFEKIVGRVVEVKAMKELPGDMLREPRFKAIRWDKTAEDID